METGSIFSTQISQKASIRRLRKQVVHRFWDYIDDFEDWRSLDVHENMWMARCKVTKGVVAIQSWPKATPETKLKLYHMAELISELHEQVPLVHRMYDVIEDKGAVLAVSEICSHGTLWDCIMIDDKIDHIPWLVCEVLVPLMVVLHHMHYSGIMHRNVNPSAVLFHSSGSACIGAFKLAARATNVNYSEMESPVDFAAPEILLCCAYDSSGAQEDTEESLAIPNSFRKPAPLSYSHEVDIWGLGVLLYLCLTGDMPFIASEDNPDAIYDSILFSEPLLPPELDPSAADFIMQCLRKQPTERPDVKQLLSHEFVTRYVNWTAAPNERLPDERYAMPASARTPLQKSFWQRMTAKISGSKSSFPMALINHTPAAATASVGKLGFARSSSSRAPEQPPPSLSPSSILKSSGANTKLSSPQKGDMPISQHTLQQDEDLQSSGTIAAMLGGEGEGGSHPKDLGAAAHTPKSHDLDQVRSRNSTDLRRVTGERPVIHLDNVAEEKIASQYNLSAMRTLDENIVSQLDLSEDATAVAMKRLSMWQENTGPQSGVPGTLPIPSGLMTMPLDSGSRNWLGGPGPSGGSGTVERLVAWSRTSPGPQMLGKEDNGGRGDNASPDDYHRRIEFGDSSNHALQEDSLSGLMEGVDIVEEELISMGKNSAVAPGRSHRR